MIEFADFRELFRLHQEGGVEGLNQEALVDLDATISGLMQGLVANFHPNLVGTSAFAFQFNVDLPTGDPRSFFLSQSDSGEVTATEGQHARPTLTLNAPLEKMIYIICGTSRDSTTYRARIFAWFHSGQISGDGDLMMLQAMQGSFKVGR